MHLNTAEGQESINSGDWQNQTAHFPSASWFIKPANAFSVLRDKEIALEMALRDLLAVTQWVKIMCNDCYTPYYYLTSPKKWQKTEESGIKWKYIWAYMGKFCLLQWRLKGSLKKNEAEEADSFQYRSSCPVSSWFLLLPVK